MKKSIFSQFVLSLVLFTFSTLATASNTYALPEIAPTKTSPVMMVTLPAGTTVSLTLNQIASSEELEIGNSLDFMVRSNVTVNGQVVIAAGSIALGWVKNVDKACDDCAECNNSCSKITITVESVQAVDGQMVNLRSVPHVVKGKCCGRGASTANIGSNLRANVLNNITINA